MQDKGHQIVSGAPSPGSVRPAALRRALGLTHAGMVAETFVRSFWPFVSLVLVILTALMFGLQDRLPSRLLWPLSSVLALSALALLGYGLLKLRLPRRADAEARLDATLPGQPLRALADRQAIGSGDPASEAVWQAHLARMAARLQSARAVAPDLRLASRDVYGLRLMAATGFVMALLFGSVWQIGTVAGLAPPAGAGTGAAEASWEGWLEPPRFTGKPSVYLADQPEGRLEVPQGTVVTLRLYGDTSRIRVSDSVSGRAENPDPSAPVQSFAVLSAGELTISGPGGRSWQVSVIPDLPPEIAAKGPATRTARGEMKLGFIAEDDYGVMSARARIALDESRLDRRYGLALVPEPRPPLEIELPLRVRGDRRYLDNEAIEDLSAHPWAHLPVVITLMAEDAAGQTGAAAPQEMVLPGRRFFDTMAGALVENRRDLLWNRDNAPRVAQVLRAVSWQPETGFNMPGVYLKLRTAILRLEAELESGPLTDAFRDELAEVLWSLALEIEDGTLDSALERMREAQRRLAEAIRNGATPEEIARLMEELREATDQYVEMLAQQAPDGTDTPQQGPQGEMISGDQLAEMMQRLQELMEQGRTAEAQALLAEIQQLLENMQVTRGQGGGPGQQSMEGLGEALREQQELSDETFGDLNNRDTAPGRPGQRQPGQGRGTGQRQAPQDPPGDPSQGEPGGNPAEGRPGGGQPQGRPGGSQGGDQDQPGRDRPGAGGGDDADERGSLAERQRALREAIRRERERLPGGGTEEGRAAREALDRAGEAMDRAGEALERGDLAGALDDQAAAMEELREGMRQLGEQMAREASPGDSEEASRGESGQDGPGGRRDPLGRDPSARGPMLSEEQMLTGEDVYRRARELLEELRRRAGDQERSAEELDYLRRLLERF